MITYDTVQEKNLKNVERYVDDALVDFCKLEGEFVQIPFHYFPFKIEDNAVLLRALDELGYTKAYNIEIIVEPYERTYYENGGDVTEVGEDRFLKFTPIKK
jgi:hypothetical protein